MKRIMILGLIFWRLPAHADNCDQPKNNFDGLYCLNKVYIQTDKDLNDTYQKLQAKLDPEGRKLLKTRQLAWIEKRNKLCSYHDRTGFFCKSAVRYRYHPQSTPIPSRAGTRVR